MRNIQQSLENTRRSLENAHPSSAGSEFDATRDLTTQKRLFEDLKPKVESEFQKIKEKYEKEKPGLDARVLSHINTREEIQATQMPEGAASFSPNAAKMLRAAYRDLTKASTDVVPTLQNYLSKIEQSQKDFKGAFDSAVQQHLIHSGRIDSVTEPMHTFAETGKREVRRIQTSIAREQREIRNLYSSGTGSNIEKDIQFEDSKPQLEGVKDSVKREHEKLVNTHGPKVLDLKRRLNLIRERRESIENAFDKTVQSNLDAPLPSTHAEMLRKLYTALTRASRLDVPSLQKDVEQAEALHDAFESAYGSLAQESHMASPFIRDVTEPMRIFVETGKRGIGDIQASIAQEKTNIKDLYLTGTQGNIESDILIATQQRR